MRRQFFVGEPQQQPPGNTSGAHSGDECGVDGDMEDYDFVPDSATDATGGSDAAAAAATAAAAPPLAFSTAGIHQYLHAIEAFRREFTVLVHLTAGLPAHAP
jgi:hypothetical protein